MRNNDGIRWVMVLGCVGMLGGCARLDYVKVPTPTQYRGWTDQEQRKADAMKGVRYYLPRPFLHLKESIPVAQRVAFVSFHLDKAQGAYLLDPPENPPTWLTRVVPGKISITQALAATLAQPQAAAAKPQAGTPGTEKSPSGTEAPAPPSTLKATTGFINESDPVTALSAKMDVVYLPDFEEQYVIRPRTGLGKAQIETRLRNGWAAEVFSQDVDNSQVIPYVIKQVEQASEAAAGIVTTWMPVVAPGTSLAALPGLLGKQPGAAQMQAGGVGVTAEAVEKVLGNVLLFKIAEVRIAQPGLYPILKPREIKQWLKYDGPTLGSDAQARFEDFLTRAQLPWVRPDMAFVPCPPFTVIGFNTTTDVYLMPATERVVIPQSTAASSEKDQPVEKYEEAGKEIKTAMVKRSAALGHDSALISEQSIEVKPEATTKSQTVIGISAPKTVSFTSDEKAIREWIINVFNTPGASKLDDADVKVNKSQDGKTVEITINRSIVELAQQAKQVQ